MMSVIETQIWEAVPDKKGYVRYVGQRKLVEVFNELEAYLKKEDIYPEEYFLQTHSKFHTHSFNTNKEEFE